MVTYYWRNCCLYIIIIYIIACGGTLLVSWLKLYSNNNENIKGLPPDCKNPSQYIIIYYRRIKINFYASLLYRIYLLSNEVFKLQLPVVYL